MPPKKIVKKKKAGKKVVRRKNNYITMNQMINKMCITKTHQFANLNVLRPWGQNTSGTSNVSWYLHFPANLNRNTGVNATIDVTDRESSRVHFKNCKYEFTIQPDRHYYSGLQYRIVFGYFKGDDATGTQGLTTAQMTNMCSKINDPVKHNKPGTYSNPGGPDFYIKYESKKYSITPKMVYDANGSDDRTTGSSIIDGVSQSGGEPIRGVWNHRHHKLNFQLNRTLSYETQDGDSLNGWCPFLGIQMLGIQYGLTRPDVVSSTDPATFGNFPSPKLELSCTSYFCDLH